MVPIILGSSYHTVHVQVFTFILLNTFFITYNIKNGVNMDLWADADIVWCTMSAFGSSLASFLDRGRNMIKT